MSARIKKQMQAVDEKIHEARRAVYMPDDTKSNDEVERQDLSAFERRLIHDEDRRISARRNHATLNDHDNVPNTSFHNHQYYPPKSFAPGVSTLVPEKLRSSADSASIAEQSRVYTVGQILGTRPPISSADRDMLRKSTNSRPRSALEQRQLQHADERRLFGSDFGTESYQTAFFHRFSDLPAANGTLPDGASSTSVKVRPRSSSPAFARSVNVDKDVQIRQLVKNSRGTARTTAPTNLDVAIRKPRLFSHLKRITSDKNHVDTGVMAIGDRAEFDADVWNGTASKRTTIPEVSKKTNGVIAGSTSSTTTTRSSENHRPVVTLSSSNRTSPVHSQALDHGSRRTPSLSSSISGFSSLSPPSKLEAHGPAKNINEASSSSPSSRTHGDLGDDSSIELENGRSRSDFSSKRSQATSEDQRRSTGRKPSGSDEAVTVASSKQNTPLPSKQRRVVSPPRRRRFEGKEKIDNDNQEMTALNRRTRSYDSAVIRSYIERKRKERKTASSCQPERDELGIDKRRTSHKYGQEEIEQYMKKRKESESWERRRAMERMQAAKMEQQRRMKEIREEQKKRQPIPVTQIIGTDNLPVTNLKVQKPAKEGARPLLDDFDRKVAAIRAKYTLPNGNQQTRGVFASNGETSTLALNSNPEGEYLYNGQNGNSRQPARSAAPSNCTATTENNAIGRKPAELDAQPRRTNEVDEYNIVNTILRKHPYLRVTTLYMPGYSRDGNVIPHDSGGRGSPDRIPPVRNASRYPNESLEDHVNGNYSLNRSISATSVQPRPLPRWNAVGVVSAPDQDSNLSAQHNIDGALSSISSLTLTSDEISASGADLDIERPRALPMLGSNGLNESGESVANGEISSGLEVSPVATSNLRLRAGLNYMQALQYSLDQIEAAKDISSLVLAEQRETAANDLIQANAAAQHWEHQLREARVNAELQRVKGEMDRTTAAHELRLAAEMTDNQRRLMETIITTNRQLLEQNRAYQHETAARTNITDGLMPSAEATKLVAEVAASAAAAATLAALKRGGKQKTSSVSVSSSTSTESSLSAASRSSTGGMRSASGSSQVITAVSGSKADTVKNGESPQGRSKSPSVLESLPEVGSVSSTPLVMTQSNVDGISASGQSEMAINTERSVPSITEEVASASKASTDRSSQTSPTRSQVGTQTGGETTAETASSNNSSSTIQELSPSNPNHSLASTPIATDIATVPSSSVPTEINGQPTRSRSVVTEESNNRNYRSSELSGHTSDEASSSSVTADPIKPVAAGSGRHHLDLEKLPVMDDHFSLSMSDMSEHESRIQALRINLDERRRVAEKLKQEYKRRVKTSLHNTEKSLLNQLNAYDTFIEKAEKQLEELQKISAGKTQQEKRSVTPPKIMSPRASSDADIFGSPGRRSASSSPRSARSTKASGSSSQRMQSGHTTPGANEGEISTAGSVKSVLPSTVMSERLGSDSSSSSPTSSPRTVASISIQSVPTAVSVGSGTNSQSAASPAEQTPASPVHGRQSVNAETVEEASELLDEAESASEVPSASQHASSARSDVSGQNADSLIGNRSGGNVNDTLEDEEITTPTAVNEDFSHRSLQLGEKKAAQEGEMQGRYSNQTGTNVNGLERTPQSERAENVPSPDPKDAYEPGTELAATVSSTSSRSARSISTPRSGDEPQGKSASHSEGSSTQSGHSSSGEEDTKTARSTSSQISSNDVVARSVSSDPEIENKATVREMQDTSEKESMDKERMKSRSILAADVIVNAVLYDTISYCLNSWRVHADKVLSCNGNGKKMAGRKLNDKERNRLADVVADDTVRRVLDEAIQSIIFARKRPALGKSQEESSAVIDEKRLENLRRLVSNIDNDKGDLDDGVISTGSSPRSATRSPRTPLSDRYNEAFRQPSPRIEMMDIAKPAVPIADDDFAASEEQWMDDDFGLGETDDALGGFVHKPSSPRSARLDLTKFTTEIFSAVPSTKSTVNSVIDVCVQTLTEQRRAGEPLASSRKPPALYNVGKEDESKDMELSSNRESDRIYRDFLFDLSREIVEDIYSEGKDNKWTSVIDTASHQECPKWKKPPRLRFSTYSKLRPKSLAECQSVVRETVTSQLDLEPERNLERTARLKSLSRRTLDRVDEIVLAEIYEEERDWTIYDDEELWVKLQLADDIMETVLNDALEKAAKNDTQKKPHE